MNYSLEFLENKFIEHSKRYQIQQDEYERKIKENKWEKPEYEDGFNLPEALLTMIREIKELKQK